MHLTIIGPMGAGKTSIGKQIGQYFELPFYDMDAIIEERQALPIVDIFQRHGEAYFRDLEADLLRELSQKSDAVIATGGGIVTSEKSRELLAKLPQVIYLQVSVASQLHRLNGDTTRPLLLVENKQQKLEQLQAVRSPLYQQVSDITINTDHFSIQQVTNQIIELNNHKSIVRDRL